MIKQQYEHCRSVITSANDLLFCFVFYDVFNFSLIFNFNLILMCLIFTTT